MKKTFKLSAVICMLGLASCQKNQLQSVTAAKNSAPGAKMSARIFPGATAIYYVDDTGGSDSNNGTSTSTAWKTVSKVNSVTFAPGNVILFKRGGSWTNQLHPTGSGSSGSPIIIDMYGTATGRPKINGAGVANGAVYLNNQQYWEINDLEITNFNSSEEAGISEATWETNNTNNYANVTLPAMVTNSNSAKFGVLIAASDVGAVNHIYLHKLLVHGVNGWIGSQTDNSKNNGGIAYQISGTTTSTWFNDILVDSCNVHDCDKTGMYFTSTWDSRTISSNGTWKASTSVVVRADTFVNSAANALIIRVATSPLMEHNLFDHCAIKTTGNAAFNFNTDNAKWQYNECRYTKANDGDSDAGGIDADYNTKNTVIQYNYIHNNDFGLLITGGPGGSDNFNDGTLLKYNIIEKDGTQAHSGTQGKFFLKLSGAATNTSVYNNTMDIGPSQSATQIVYCYTWNGASPATSVFYNNIIDNSGTTSSYNLGSSTGNTFDYNLYDNNAATSQPSQTHNITGDPMFVSPGSGPAGYLLKVGSAAYNNGKVISTNGGKDYYGNAVSTTVASNIGAYNGPLQ